MIRESFSNYGNFVSDWWGEKHIDGNLASRYGVITINQRIEDNRIRNLVHALSNDIYLGERWNA